MGPVVGDCICHTLPYTTYTGLWGLLWETVYSIQTIYIPYNIYRVVGPALGDRIFYTNHIHPLQYIQRCGACSGGLYMLYKAYTSLTTYTGLWGLLWGIVDAIQSIYIPYNIHRDVGPALGDFIWQTNHIQYIPGCGLCSGERICHTLPHTAYTGIWGLVWGTVYTIHCHIQHIQGCGTCPVECISNTLSYTAYAGMWGLLWGIVYAIHWPIQQIQGCGPCFPGQYMPYTATYSMHRDVGPALGDSISHALEHTGMWGDCICYKLPFRGYTGMWTLSQGLYMPYAIIYSIYRDVGPSLGDCICHILPYTAYTGMWGLL